MLDKPLIRQARQASRQGFVRHGMLPPGAPPARERGAMRWLRQNLFSNWGSTLTTVAALWLLWQILPPVLDFAVFHAVWSGEGREACTTAAQGGMQPDGWFGACWTYVGAYLGQFFYGRYPAQEIWRVNLTGLLFAAGLAPLLIASLPGKRETLLYLMLVFPVAAFILLTGGHLALDGFLLPRGMLASGAAAFWLDYALLAAGACLAAVALARAAGTGAGPVLRPVLTAMAGAGAVIGLCAADFGLARVDTDLWGGLVVTLVIAVSGIAASLPLGILLALGRRSKMPAVRVLSIAFIEFWRGVPLITVLFMASVMLPLFLPEGVTVDKLLRALIGVALFSAAYMAEVVRGGLQAIPKGQYEGAAALGLRYGPAMRLIVLPQALKLVIPGIVNTFIGLFKDTTLVLIIGLFDFLGMIQLSFRDPHWASPVQSMSGYLFAAIIFFLFCYGMSRYSIYMERRLDTGHK